MANITSSLVFPSSIAPAQNFFISGSSMGGDIVTETIIESVAIFGNIMTSSVSRGGESGIASDPFTMGTSIAVIYVQRIFDTSLGVYVYYKLPTITITPGSEQTSPPHTGIINLDATRHELVATTFERT